MPARRGSASKPESPIPCRVASLEHNSRGDFVMLTILIHLIEFRRRVTFGVVLDTFASNRVLISEETRVT